LDNLSVKIFLLVACFILSAFFSGSEVALFSFDLKKINDLKKEHQLIGRYIDQLLKEPRRLLVTILLGNTVVNVGASIISVSFALQLSRLYRFPVEIVIIVQIVLLAAFLLLFGEVTPKLWATKYPGRFSMFVAFPLYWISYFLTPITLFLSDFMKFVISRFNLNRVNKPLFSEEITELADLGIEKGTIEKDEHGLIRGIIKFKTVCVREIMKPRVGIEAISLDSDVNEVMDIVRESAYSRLPLYENNLDKIVGIIYAKDLLPYFQNPELKKSLSLKNIAREVYFIPETKLIDQLLHEFQIKNLHMGIVVDEYGGTAGLVSMEDILEEIVGDIKDEYDVEENNVSKLDDGGYLVLGKISINELNELLDNDFASQNDDYDTLAGFILNFAGKIPTQGFHFTYNNYKFTVKDVYKKRITKVLIENISSTDNESPRSLQRDI
jgi:gliding motility-associated protein GldE